MSFYLAPPGAAGSTAELRAVFTYLHKMAEYLNVAMNSIEAESLTPAARETLSGSGQAAQKKQAGEYSALKSLIIKTADVVRSEMNVLETRLHSATVAESEFGAYREEVGNAIRAAAENVEARFTTKAELNSYAEGQASVTQYAAETSQYIRAGILRYENGVPVVGIAVGKDLAAETADGVTTILQQGFRSTFTADRLSFWHGETEVAYVSDNMLHINEAQVMGKLTLGNWEMSAAGGLTLKWIGG